MGTGLSWDVNTLAVCDKRRTQLNNESDLNAKEKEMGTSGCDHLATPRFYIYILGIDTMEEFDVSP